MTESIHRYVQWFSGWGKCCWWTGWKGPSGPRWGESRKHPHPSHLTIRHVTSENRLRCGTIHYLFLTGPFGSSNAVQQNTLTVATELPFIAIPSSATRYSAGQCIRSRIAAESWQRRQTFPCQDPGWILHCLLYTSPSPRD